MIHTKCSTNYQALKMSSLKRYFICRYSSYWSWM